jgi:hypothetical protein
MARHGADCPSCIEKRIHEYRLLGLRGQLDCAMQKAVPGEKGIPSRKWMQQQTAEINACVNAGFGDNGPRAPPQSHRNLILRLRYETNRSHRAIGLINAVIVQVKSLPSAHVW